MSTRGPEAQNRAGGRWFFMTSAAVIFLFLYLPLVVLVAFSFQESRILSWPIESWSLHWYRVLVNDAEMIAAVGNSIFVATTCVAITTLVGVPLALALRRLGGRMGTGIERVLLLPLIIPQLITGLALLLILNRIGVGLSLGTVILGQSLVWMPIVVTQVLARLQRVNPNLEKASMDLGAGPWHTFFRITLPAIRTSIIGSALLVFTLSFDELPVTFFLTGSRNTLPMHIWSMLRIGITPEINAIATVTVGVSVILILTGMCMLAGDRGRS